MQVQHNAKTDSNENTAVWFTAGCVWCSVSVCDHWGFKLDHSLCYFPPCLQSSRPSLSLWASGCLWASGFTLHCDTIVPLCYLMSKQGFRIWGSCFTSSVQCAKLKKRTLAVRHRPEDSIWKEVWDGGFDQIRRTVLIKCHIKQWQNKTPMCD